MSERICLQNEQERKRRIIHKILFRGWFFQCLSCGPFWLYQLLRKWFHFIDKKHLHNDVSLSAFLNCRTPVLALSDKMNYDSWRQERKILTLFSRWKSCVKQYLIRDEQNFLYIFHAGSNVSTSATHSSETIPMKYYPLFIDFLHVFLQFPVPATDFHLKVLKVTFCCLQAFNRK